MDKNGAQCARDTACYELLSIALDRLNHSKPNDFSALDLRYAVTITEMEKVMAYFVYHVFMDNAQTDADVLKTAF